jgi:hypothetical protein
MLANKEESAELYAQFARVAETNPVSWNFGQPAATKEEIGTVSERNRMICYPCKLPSIYFWVGRERRRGRMKKY